MVSLCQLQEHALKNYSKRLESERVRISDSYILFGSIFVRFQNCLKSEQICSDFRHKSYKSYMALLCVGYEQICVWNPNKFVQFELYLFGYQTQICVWNPNKFVRISDSFET